MTIEDELIQRAKLERASAELLDRLIETAKDRVDRMSEAELQAMIKLQGESWVRAELGWPKPKFKWVNGVKVYDSMEDYRND